MRLKIAVSVVRFRPWAPWPPPQYQQPYQLCKPAAPWLASGSLKGWLFRTTLSWSREICLDWIMTERHKTSAIVSRWISEKAISKSEFSWSRSGTRVRLWSNAGLLHELPETYRWNKPSAFDAGLPPANPAVARMRDSSGTWHSGGPTRQVFAPCYWLWSGQQKVSQSGRSLHSTRKTPALPLDNGMMEIHRDRGSACLFAASGSRDL